MMNNKGFKHINQSVKAPESIKKDVMWHINKVFFMEAIIKHFTINFTDAFSKFFKDNNKQ